MSEAQKIVAVFLDEDVVIRRSAEVEHERAVAVYDLIEDNRFQPASGIEGPFNLHLAIEENRLRFDIRDENDAPKTSFTLPLTTFRRIIRDYFVICDSYYQAIKTASPSKIEAIDMGRRGIHNEGSELLRERIAEYVDVDIDTARRLFTLICVLHVR